MRAVLSWVLLGLMVIPLGWFTPAAFAQELNFFDLFNLTEREDGYFSMVNQADHTVLLRTARILHVGTGFIDSENRRFRVTAIEGDIARAERLEKEGRKRLPPAELWRKLRSCRSRGISSRIWMKRIRRRRIRRITRK